MSARWTVLFLVAFSAFLGVLGRNVGKEYSLVLIGGGLYDNNTAIWERIIELGGGKGAARFGVISAASEDPCCDADSSWVYYRDLLTKYGAAEVYYIPVTTNTTEQNLNPVVVAHIKTLTGFFFGGGDQLRIIESFYNVNAKIPSPALRAIRQTLYATGGVVAGTSAGTDIQTNDVMITGGESYQGVVQGATVTWEPREKKDLNALTGYGPGGIGLFGHGLLDTHFANRGRHGRLIQLLVDSSDVTRGAMRAFGVDENTALVVTGPWNARSATVLGQRGAWIFSSQDAAHSDLTATTTGVSVSRISNGDVLDLNSYQITPAAYKSALVQSATVAATSSNIFGEEVFELDRIALSLLQSSVSAVTQGTTKQSSPQVVVKLGKHWRDALENSSNNNKQAQGFGGTDPSTGLFAYCFSDLWLSMSVQKEQ
eukprot:gene7544-9041_t